MMSTDPPALEVLDVGQLALFTGLAMAEQILDALAARGFDSVRFQHGFLLQHVLRAPPTITGLAALLGVSQQAASKRVHELVGFGYLALIPDPQDQRRQRVTLTPRGQLMVATARQLRQEQDAALRSSLGAARFSALKAALVEVLDGMGGRPEATLRSIRWPR